VAIGAIIFTGSVIAFLKLDGRMSGKPIMLPQRHAINIGLAVACSSCSSCSSAAKATSRSGSSCWFVRPRRSADHPSMSALICASISSRCRW
jgi:NAD/NADP transhydrogenase beta subunit